MWSIDKIIDSRCGVVVRLEAQEVCTAKHGERLNNHDERLKRMESTADQIGVLYKIIALGQKPEIKGE